MMSFTKDLKDSPLKTKKKLFRNHKKCDFALYRKIVQDKFNSFEKGTLINHSDPSKMTYSKLNTYTKKLTDILHKCFEEACPLSSVRTPCKHKWWSEDLTTSQNRIINTKKRKEDNPSDRELAGMYNEGYKAMKKLLRKNSNENWRAFCTNIKKTKDTSRINKALRTSHMNNLGMLQKDDETFTSSPLDTVEYLTQSLFTQEPSDPSFYGVKSPRYLNL